MLDFMLSEKHAISILKKDHENVKELFDRFEKIESEAEKEKIIVRAVMELKIHATIEEEIFYPTVRKEIGTDIMNEADEEHHVARVLIAELDAKGGGGTHRNAKFIVLAESVRHHIKEEENEMLPKAKALEIDFEALGQKMLDRKRELKEKGIPKDKEHAMVARVNGKDNSPAAASRKAAPRAKQTARKSSVAHSRTSKGGSAQARH
jgi:hypothetical protein